MELRVLSRISLLARSQISLWANALYSQTRNLRPVVVRSEI
jgi:hypothetical protein